jgi:hypothetical protein
VGLTNSLRILWKPRTNRVRVSFLITIFFATSVFVSGQSAPSDRSLEPSPSASSDQPDDSTDAVHPSLLTPLKPQTQEAPYRPITPGQRLRWVITNTIGPPHLLGGILTSAFGTAINRPEEYGPHWGGFADRYGIGIAGTATNNAIEASVGLVMREDPRYFRAPDRPFKSRVANVVRLTFMARTDDGGYSPAYARYAAFFGGEFFSNTWRVQSEDNGHDALIRTGEDFAGRMVINAVEEFWPDVKKVLFHKRD